MLHMKGEPTGEVLKKLDHTWTAVFVGDAWMAPSELTHIAAARSASTTATRSPAWTGCSASGSACRTPIWLNPEPRRRWNEPSIRLIRRVFPMYELTIDGLTEAVDVLRGTRPNRPSADPIMPRRN